jgi:hypothetical protein
MRTDITGGGDKEKGFIGGSRYNLLKLEITKEENR